MTPADSGAAIDDAAYYEAALAGEPVEHVRALGRHQHDQRKAREREVLRGFLNRNPGWSLHLLGGVVVWR